MRPTPPDPTPYSPPPGPAIPGGPAEPVTALGGLSVAAVTGSDRLTEETAGRVARRLVAAARRQPGWTLVDLGGVRFASAAGVGALAAAGRSGRAAGGRVGLLNVAPRVELVLRLTRVDTLLSVWPAPTASWLARCQSCARTLAADAVDVGRYLAAGGPRCCGEDMTFELVAAAHAGAPRSCPASDPKPGG